MDEVLAAARAVEASRLGERALCDACLGRLFGKVGHGYTNEARGRAVRGVLGVAAGPCWTCGDLTSRYDALADLVVRKLEPWEFDSFSIGSKIDPEIAKRVSDRVRKEPDLGHPDVVAIVDTMFDHVDIQVNPLYLRGRYRKLIRGVPQTRWPCRTCQGKGCARCGGLGRMYPTSVEEVLATEVMKDSGGSGHALHGM